MLWGASLLHRDIDDARHRSDAQEKTFLPQRRECFFASHWPPRSCLRRQRVQRLALAGRLNHSDISYIAVTFASQPPLGHE